MDAYVGGTRLSDIKYGSAHVNSNNNNKVIHSGSACSVLFLSTTGLFSRQNNFLARDAVECSNVFLIAGKNPGVVLTVLSTENHCLFRLGHASLLQHAQYGSCTRLKINHITRIDD